MLFSYRTTSSTFLRLSQYARLSTSRLWYIAAMMTALALFTANKWDNVYGPAIRNTVLDITAPLIEFSMRTSQSVEQLMHNITHWQFVYEENKRLREELAKTTAIQQLNIKLATENASLRQQVSMVPDDFPIIASARVIRMPYGNFSHTLLLNVGIDQGVEKGAVVIASGKVVGRIIESSNRTSQVLMLTDMHSRIPATLASNRIQAILSGNSKGALRLTHMDKEHEIIAGDHLFTSGTGGIFPPGLYIGQIKDADKKTVRPAADLRRLDIVTIVGQPLKP